MFEKVASCREGRTVAARTLATAPTPDQVAAIPSPIDRARLITAIANHCGTLSTPLADMRRNDLIAARANGWKLAELADEVGVTIGRVWQLTKQGVAAGQPTQAPAVTADPERTTT